MLSLGCGESGALSWANDTCGHTESDRRQSQRPTPRVKPESLPSRQKTETLKLLTCHRHIGARVEVLEQTHLGRFLLLQVVPSIARFVLGIHGAADVVPPDQVHAKQLAVCHGRPVTQRQRPVVDGCKWTPDTARRVKVVSRIARPGGYGGVSTGGDLLDYSDPSIEQLWGSVSVEESNALQNSGRGLICIPPGVSTCGNKILQRLSVELHFAGVSWRNE